MTVQNENPLHNLLSDGGYCAIFRRIGCIGDSFASGEFESKTNGVIGWHDYYEYSWGQYMARACGATAYNFSCGGLTARAFLERIQEEQFDIFAPTKKCQAYIIALGCNDIRMIAAGNQSFGSIEDVHPQHPELNPDTFAGCMGKILSYVKQVEHKARIFLVTLPFEPDEKNCALQDQHAILMHQLATRFPFTYVLDLREYAPPYDAAFRRKYYLAGHLNPMGYVLTAKMFMTYIDYIIQSCPEEFAQVGFVGQDSNLHNEDYLW